MGFCQTCPLAAGFDRDHPCPASGADVEFQMKFQLHAPSFEREALHRCLVHRRVINIGSASAWWNTLGAINVRLCLWQAWHGRQPRLQLEQDAGRHDGLSLRGSSGEFATMGPALRRSGSRSGSWTINARERGRQLRRPYSLRLVALDHTEATLHGTRQHEWNMRPCFAPVGFHPDIARSLEELQGIA